MLSVRLAAALARNLPRRAGFVSTSNLFMFSCVGAKNLHTAQHWLQKTGQCARNLLQVFMNFWLYP
uniref:Uncharacterized protein n=1 Tax=Xiphophorus couchianus TaxID=32473 RepID=A0A3B5MAI3_9TELE